VFQPTLINRSQLTLKCNSGFRVSEEADMHDEQWARNIQNMVYEVLHHCHSQLVASFLQEGMMGGLQNSCPLPRPRMWPWVRLMSSNEYDTYSLLCCRKSSTCQHLLLRQNMTPPSLPQGFMSSWIPLAVSLSLLLFQPHWPPSSRASLPFKTLGQAKAHPFPWLATGRWDFHNIFYAVTKGGSKEKSGHKQARSI
jgi:hypothetical protein